jgi:hypothetical protein
MTRIHFTAIALFFLFLTACSHRVPTATVEIVDTSLSITPRAERAALDAVRNQIGRMQRGDVLVLIPIVGDARNDVDGRILRFQAPVRREAYDADLGRFRADAQKRFVAWVASPDLYASMTDILGALDAARQEIASFPAGSSRRLVVVSDFLEDDGTERFVRDKAIATPAYARELAARLRAEHGLALPGVSLCLGRLESSDYAQLSEERKEAVTAFWSTYLAGSGQQPEIRFDGTGMLADVEHVCPNKKP